MRACWPATDTFVQKIRDATARGPILQKVAINITDEGPAEVSAVSQSVRPYHLAQADITLVNGLVVHGARIVIPENLKQMVISVSNESHQGKSK